MKHSLHLYGTLGPACATKEKIRTMFLSGMTGMRLNLSHSNLDDCKDWLQQYYEVSERLHIVPELLVDLQGPELRIGTLDIPLSLSENDLIFLVSEKSFDKRKENSAIFSRIIAGEDELSIIPCPDILFSYFDEGQEVKLNDGKIVLELSAPLEEDIFCAKVKKGGELTSRKSIAAAPMVLLWNFGIEALPYSYLAGWIAMLITEGPLLVRSYGRLKRGENAVI